MPALITPLLADAQLNIDIKMESADALNTTAKDEGQVAFTIKMKGFEGDQKISMNTSALESKLSAFKLILQISQSMGTSFAPYCEAILPLITSHLDYPYSKNIRKFALKTIQYMLVAVGEPNNVKLFNTILPMLVSMLEKGI